MTIHDVLAYTIAIETVRQIRTGHSDWAECIPTGVYATSSRAWPMPDFVIASDDGKVTLAAEFKPPEQTKREYLTGLGQAIAYTRSFDYGAIILPTISDDAFPIAEFIVSVLSQPTLATLPLAVMSYDPASFSVANPVVTLKRALIHRTSAVLEPATLDSSFYAKWREISPLELGLYLGFLYDEGRKTSSRPIRERAFSRLWSMMIKGHTTNFAGQSRKVTDTETLLIAQFKNYRNFVEHIGWCLSDGKLTSPGLDAHRLVHQYGHGSAVFLDALARAVLIPGKHLVLINAINEAQDKLLESQRMPSNHQAMLDGIEEELEEQGLLKRNPGRSAAAVKMSKRQFLKAEKQLWRELRFIIPAGPKGGRSYHPSRGFGFIFDWRRISALLNQGGA